MESWDMYFILSLLFYDGDKFMIHFNLILFGHYFWDKLYDSQIIIQILVWSEVPYVLFIFFIWDL